MHFVNPKTGKTAGERRKQRIASPLSGRAAAGHYILAALSE
jgi:hypothetical protein